MPEALIDITRLLDRRMQGRLPTGIDRVSLEYVRYLQRRATALVRYLGRWIELSQPESIRVFEALLEPPPHFSHLVKRTVARALPRSFGRRFTEPRFLFNTGHNGLEQQAFIERLQQSRLKPLFFIHDLIPLTHPEYCRPGEAKRHRIRMHTMLTLGQGILANSATTLEQLAEYAHRQHLPLPPATVAPLAPADLAAADACPLLTTPYFVILGTIEPRKNHWMILQLWRQLIERMGDRAPRLVVIGQRGWECENVIDLLERCTVLRGYVFEYSACDDTELAAWLLHAQALLFPSFTEGYGMPLVEALTLGVPVIASDLPVFREIAGTVPEYVDPLDGRGWAEAIVAYAQKDAPARQAQQQRMSRFSPPTWETHFAQVEYLLEQLRAAS
ncbi:glycosyltransferase family 4 protein [Desulfobulbus propionicus]